ncbi:hypothetical protein N0V87_004549 [Didymella glomerata]|uniref:RRM domain-containing protein n=1 Tax=Didymella glomerata TaxID=749621 RepID=A0A9W9C0H3_9PLEO|nr:hypothetical protein N0V87_004549 [Didymella glomerata]
MSHSPQSSNGVVTASSPYAGTDPTLYSPELARYTRSTGFHRRNAPSQITVTDDRKGSLHNTGTASPKYKGVLPFPAPYYQGLFANEVSEDLSSFISRFQFVAQLPDGTNAGVDSEHELFSVQHQMKLYQCFSSCVPVYTRGVHLRYDDLREAAEAKDILSQHGFVVDWISGYEFALAKSQDTAQLNEFEGQIKVPVTIQPCTDYAAFEFTDADLVEVLQAIEITAGVFGTIRNCVHVETHDTKMTLVFRVEFHSVDAATRAVQSLTVDSVWGVNNSKTFRWSLAEPAPWSGERAMNSPHRTKPRVDDQGRFVGYRPASAPFNGPCQRHPADQHNRVRRERILDGSDVRTTIMLRNIPNKMDWMSLKTILDEICFGTYDFLYLRIDFKSGCNVGYAFINFADVGGMIALIDRIERRNWTAYRSSKAAEISYATIQGREALVQKFRNSSVMQETPFCRPRLFLTYLDADVSDKLRATGTEQSFPRPDNLSKLQRSMDSARSVGLYPPHGFSAVSEHRNRASAYDRGTPRDVIQAAVNFARQRAAPVPLQGLSDLQKRDVEVWYSYNYGQGQVGYIPFNYIPMTHVAQYFAEGQASPNSVTVNHPGVIGAPVVNTPYKREHFGTTVTTPTRRPRVNGSPSYARSDRREQANSNFA